MTKITGLANDMRGNKACEVPYLFFNDNGSLKDINSFIQLRLRPSSHMSRFTYEDEDGMHNQPGYARSDLQAFMRRMFAYFGIPSDDWAINSERKIDEVVVNLDLYLRPYHPSLLSQLETLELKNCLAPINSYKLVNKSNSYSLNPKLCVGNPHNSVKSYSDSQLASTAFNKSRALSVQLGKQIVSENVRHMFQPDNHRKLKTPFQDLLVIGDHNLEDLEPFDQLYLKDLYYHDLTATKNIWQEFSQVYRVENYTNYYLQLDQKYFGKELSSWLELKFKNFPSIIRSNDYLEVSDTSKGLLNSMTFNCYNNAAIKEVVDLPLKPLVALELGKASPVDFSLAQQIVNWQSKIFTSYMAKQQNLPSTERIDLYVDKLKLSIVECYKQRLNVDSFVYAYSDLLTTVNRQWQNFATNAGKLIATGFYDHKMAFNLISRKDINNLVNKYHSQIGYGQSSYVDIFSSLASSLNFNRLIMEQLAYPLDFKDRKPLFNHLFEIKNYHSEVKLENISSNINPDTEEDVKLTTKDKRKKSSANSQSEVEKALSFALHQDQVDGNIEDLPYISYSYKSRLVTQLFNLNTDQLYLIYQSYQDKYLPFNHDMFLAHHYPYGNSVYSLRSLRIIYDIIARLRALLNLATKVNLDYALSGYKTGSVVEDLAMTNKKYCDRHAFAYSKLFAPITFRANYEASVVNYRDKLLSHTSLDNFFLASNLLLAQKPQESPGYLSRLRGLGKDNFQLGITPLSYGKFAEGFKKHLYIDFNQQLVRLQSDLLKANYIEPLNYKSIQNLCSTFSKEILAKNNSAAQQDQSSSKTPKASKKLSNKATSSKSASKSANNTAQTISDTIVSHNIDSNLIANFSLAVQKNLAKTFALHIEGQANQLTIFDTRLWRNFTRYNVNHGSLIAEYFSRDFVLGCAYAPGVFTPSKIKDFSCDTNLLSHNYNFIDLHNNLIVTQVVQQRAIKAQLLDIALAQLVAEKDQCNAELVEQYLHLSEQRQGQAVKSFEEHARVLVKLSKSVSLSTKEATILASHKEFSAETSYQALKQQLLKANYDKFKDKMRIYSLDDVENKHLLNTKDQAHEQYQERKAKLASCLDLDRLNLSSYAIADKAKQSLVKLDPSRALASSEHDCQDIEQAIDSYIQANVKQYQDLILNKVDGSIDMDSPLVTPNNIYRALQEANQDDKENKKLNKKNKDFAALVKKVTKAQQGSSRSKYQDDSIGDLGDPLYCSASSLPTGKEPINLSQLASWLTTSQATYLSPTRDFFTQGNNAVQPFPWTINFAYLSDGKLYLPYLSEQVSEADLSALIPYQTYLASKKFFKQPVVYEPDVSKAIDNAYKQAVAVGKNNLWGIQPFNIDEEVKSDYSCLANPLLLITNNYEQRQVYAQAYQQLANDFLNEIKVMYIENPEHLEKTQRLVAYHTDILGRKVRQVMNLLALGSYRPQLNYQLLSIDIKDREHIDKLFNYFGNQSLDCHQAYKQQYQESLIYLAKLVDDSKMANCTAKQAGETASYLLRSMTNGLISQAFASYL